MHSGKTVEEHYAECIDKSDTDLMVIQITNPHHFRGVAATKILAERKAKFEADKHAELLDEIKKPHWSITPSFIVGFVAMVAACIAAYPVLFPQLQAQPSAPVIAKSVQASPPALDNSLKKRKQSEPALPPQLKSSKN